jgi:hypothetical protein
MDRTGYDTYWLDEHHFQREGYECIPNVLPAFLLGRRTPPSGPSCRDRMPPPISATSSAAVPTNNEEQRWQADPREKSLRRGW